MTSWFASLLFGLLYRISFDEPHDRDGDVLTMRMRVRPRFGWAPGYRSMREVWKDATVTNHIDRNPT